MALSLAEEKELENVAATLFKIEDLKERSVALTDASNKARNKGETFDYLSSALEKLEADNKHTVAADVANFQTKPGQVRVELNTGVDAKGISGGSATVFTGVADNPTYGSLSIGASEGMDRQGKLGDPSIQTRYVSAPLINDKDSRFEAVGIAVTGVTIPTTNRDFTGADVSLAAGGVVIDKHTGAAFTGLVSTDAEGKDPALWGRLSGNVYEDANTRLAANLNGGYNTANQQGSIGAGFLAEHQIDKGTTVYGGVGATVNNVGGTNDLTAGGIIGMTFGGSTPAPAVKEDQAHAATPRGYVPPAPVGQGKPAAEQPQAPEARQAAVSTHETGDGRKQTTIEPHGKSLEGAVTAGSIDAQNKQNLLNEYNAMSPKQKDVFVTRMAEFYQGGHTGADLNEMKEQIKHNIVSKQDTFAMAQEAGAQHI